MYVNVMYKQFNLSVDVQGVYGNSIFRTWGSLESPFQKGLNGAILDVPGPLQRSIMEFGIINLLKRRLQRTPRTENEFP